MSEVNAKTLDISVTLKLSRQEAISWARACEQPFPKENPDTYHIREGIYSALAHLLNGED